MKRFIRDIVIFISPVVILIMVVEVVLYCMPNTYRLKSELLQQTDSTTQTIALGNSHAYYGYCASQAAGACNLANVSQTLRIDRLLLERAIHHKKALKHVLLFVDHSNLYDAPLSRGREHWRATYYKRYMNLPMESMPARDWLEVTNVASAKNKLLNLFKGNASTCDSVGWGMAYVPSPADSSLLTLSACREAAERHSLTSLSDAKINVRDVMLMAAYCEAHHLQMWVVQPPVMPGYYEHITQAQHALLGELMKRLSNVPNVRVIDMQRDSDFSREDFHDADHLNNMGARKFTKKLQAIMH